MFQMKIRDSSEITKIAKNFKEYVDMKDEK